ncbi:MAG: hypothetical protein AAFN77_18590 [Planctomycetota bacterium]
MASYDYSNNSSVKSGMSDGIKKAIAFVALLFFVFCVFLVFNLYFRYSQPLTILNATGTPAKVQIDGGEEFEVGQGLTTKKVAEGTHTVSVTSPFEAEYTIEVSNSFFGRTFNSPAFVVNLGGEGVIADMDVIYAENPPPPKVTYRCEDVMTWEDVDYPFTDMPDEISIESSSSQVHKQALEWVDMSDIAPESVFMLLLETDRGVAFRYAENHIKNHPQSHELLGYVDGEMGRGEYPRIKALMETGLEEQPVRVDWHRVYQDIPTVLKNYDSLVAKYDQYVKDNPESPQFLYLRSRIERDPARHEEFLLKAIQLDPAYGQSQISYAYLLLNQARWEDAIKRLEIARKDGIEEYEITPLMHIAKLALGRGGEMVPEYRESLKEFDGAIGPAMRLAEVLMKDGKRAEARRTYQSALRAFEKMAEGHLDEILQRSKAMGNYVIDNNPNSFFTERGLETELAYGWAEFTPPSQVKKTFQLHDERDMMMLPLVAMFGDWRNPQHLEFWWQKAGEQMDHLGAGVEPVARLIKQDVSAEEAIAAIKTGLLRPTDAAILLTALAIREKDETSRKLLIEAAREYNFQLVPPQKRMKSVLDRLERK